MLRVWVMILALSCQARVTKFFRNLRYLRFGMNWSDAVLFVTDRVDFKCFGFGLSFDLPSV